MANINAFRAIEAVKEEQSKQIYKKYMERCNRFILNHYKKTGDTQCEYRIPSLAFGQPLFDVDECIDFITVNFKATGIDVKNVGGGKMMVDWIKVAKAPKKRIPLIAERERAQNEYNYEYKINNVAKNYQRQNSNSNSKPPSPQRITNNLPALPPPVSTRVSGRRAVFNVDRTHPQMYSNKNDSNINSIRNTKIHPLTHTNTNIHNNQLNQNNVNAQTRMNQQQNFDTMSIYSTRSIQSNTSTSTARHLDVLEEFIGE